MEKEKKNQIIMIVMGVVIVVLLIAVLAKNRTTNTATNPTTTSTITNISSDETKTETKEEKKKAEEIQFGQAVDLPFVNMTVEKFEVEPEYNFEHTEKTAYRIKHKN